MKKNSQFAKKKGLGRALPENHLRLPPREFPGQRSAFFAPDWRTPGSEGGPQKTPSVLEKLEKQLLLQGLHQAAHLELRKMTRKTK